MPTKKEKILKIVKKSISIKISKASDPKEYFKNRKGLYVWNSFLNNIVERAKPIKGKVLFKVSSFDLLKISYDKYIEKDLPKKHIFSETEVCTIIENLIEKQPNGEEGILQNNGYVNVFYTPAHVVFVRWIDGEWHVYAWYRVSYTWLEGRRVFSPATGV